MGLELLRFVCQQTSTGLQCSLKRSLSLRLVSPRSYVLFVTVVTLYHVDNVFGIAVNVMINKPSFAGRIKCILRKSVVYVINCMLSSCCHNGKSREVH